MCVGALPGCSTRMPTSMELFPTQLSRALSSISRFTSPGLRSATFSIAAVTTYAWGSVRRAWRSATSSASLSTTSSSSP